MVNPAAWDLANRRNRVTSEKPGHEPAGSTPDDHDAGTISAPNLCTWHRIGHAPGAEPLNRLVPGPRGRGPGEGGQGAGWRPDRAPICAGTPGGGAVAGVSRGPADGPCGVPGGAAAGRRRPGSRPPAACRTVVLPMEQNELHSAEFRQPDTWLNPNQTWRDHASLMCHNAQACPGCGDRSVEASAGAGDPPEPAGDAGWWPASQCLAPPCTPSSGSPRTGGPPTGALALRTRDSSASVRARR